MTDDEIVSATRLDELATKKASSLGRHFSKFPDSVVDAIRLLVCELAFKSYSSFSTRFHAGNSNALRQMLDALWLSLISKNSFQDSNFVQSHLNDAEIQEEDWDVPSASDAVVSLCIFEACLRDAQTFQERLLALEDGIGIQIRHAIKKQIDECATTGGLLSELADSIESGMRLIPTEESLLTTLHRAKEFEDDPEHFVNWASHLHMQRA